MKKVALLLDVAEVPEGADLRALQEVTLRKMRGFADEIFVYTQAEAADFAGIPVLQFDTAGEFLKWCEDLGSDTVIILLNVYAALFDTRILRSMLKEHQASLYDYTYPENLPVGMVPELFTAEIARFILPTLPKQFPMFKKSVRELFESDISSYDTNLYVHPGRLMRHRVELIPSSYYHFATLQNILRKFGEDPGIDALEAGITKNPDVVRVFPTYYEIELSTEAESGDFFAGSMRDKSGEMDFAHLKGLLKQISELSYNPMVVFGLYGEPFLYSEFDALMDEMSHYPAIRFVFESRGIVFNPKRVEQVLKHSNAEIIFDLSFSDPSLFDQYKKPRNSLIPFEGYTKIRDGILNIEKKEKVYLQFTRSTVNEKELLKFYEKWSDFKERILIKKPDCLGGRLTPFRVVDLSPVERFACLHLKHDLIVRFDGSVPLCRQDLFGSVLLGNVFEEGVKVCWEKMGEFYFKQVAKEWEKPEICALCDEWWIFNN